MLDTMLDLRAANLCLIESFKCFMNKPGLTVLFASLGKEIKILAQLVTLKPCLLYYVWL